MRKLAVVLFVALGMSSLPAHANVDDAKKFAETYANHVKAIDPAYKLTAEAGRAFFTKKYARRKDNKEESCSSCHTDNPMNKGKHVDTGKAIQPLSPVANPARFSDLQKVETKFKKHCNNIIGRDCTPQEKGDYITYLLSVGNEPAKK